MSWRGPAWAPAIGALVVLAPGIAFAQRLGRATDSTDIAWWRVIGALIVCIVLAVGAAFALRMRLRGGIPSFTDRGRRLRVMESVRIGQQAEVCLLRFDDREFLIAATAQGAFLIKAADLTPVSAREP